MYIFFIFQKISDDVPDTCCKVFTEGCGKGGATGTDKIHTTGCFVKFEQFVVDNAATAAGVGKSIFQFIVPLDWHATSA